MVNAWSLAASVLDGTLDEDYPIMKTDEIKIETSDEGVVNVPNGLEYYDPTHYVDGHGDIHLVTSKDDLNVGSGNTATEPEHSPYYYDWDRNGLTENPFENDYAQAVDHLVDEMPSAFTTLADNDDQIAHHFADSVTLNIEGPTKETMSDIRNKYHEKEILEEVEEYVSRTYNGHYTGTKHEYRNVQTIDLMASRDLASDFCQANILKYGSRYGSKDGRNKKDLLKVIHYAMLLLHFDEHYGKPSMTSGNIDFNMP